MLYAVIDIETTGGYAAQNGITEIAVVITDGHSVQDSFYAMLNPLVPIPPFIESLTGITNDLVKDLPPFESIAEELYSILHDKIFVAHNVNFDYSFVKYHLAQCGFHLDSKKLCTIRLGRKVIPGLRGYGLDKICTHLKIEINGRHSAHGDATATAKVFHKLMKKGGDKFLKQLLSTGKGELSLPPNLNKESIDLLPQKPGVYFFHTKDGRVIYVGKAKNIKSRVKGHFTNNKAGQQKQEFLKKIYAVSYQETATELMAFVLEGIEIKQRWPEQNIAQKWTERVYGLYAYTDSAGYRRLFIEKQLQQVMPFFTFGTLSESYNFLRKLIKEYNLCPYLCFLSKWKDGCKEVGSYCQGACRMEESPAEYNVRVDKCIKEISEQLPSFAILDKGMKAGERSCILVEKGKFAGMGYIQEENYEIEKWKSMITLYRDNLYVRSLIMKYADKHPYQIFSF